MIIIQILQLHSVAASLSQMLGNHELHTLIDKKDRRKNFDISNIDWDIFVLKNDHIFMFFLKLYEQSVT